MPTKPTTQELVRAWLETNFVDYQLKWITEASPFALAVKSRQIGFSDAEAGATLLSGYIFRRPQLILSASEDLAEEVLDKARIHCRTMAAVGLKGANQFKVDNTTEIAWKSGGRIVALPANKRTARSFSGDVHLDEFAYHADPEGIRDGAFPMASRGSWRVRILSTPNGAQGLFHDWVMSPPPGWALHNVPVEQAISDGFPVNMEKLWQLCGGDERIFAQWYQCQFVDADLQYFPTALINAAKGYDVPLDLGDAEIFAGLDVGREHDLTALSITALCNGVLWVFPTLTCKRTSFAEQKKMIRDARSRFRWDRLHVDQTGLGRQLAEELVGEYGAHEVVPVTFTQQSKHDMVTRALRWFRDERVRLPKGKDGDMLANEITSCRRIVTSSGNIVFDTPRGANGHGDRFWALCLALWGAGEPVVRIAMGQQPLLAVA